MSSSSNYKHGAGPQLQQHLTGNYYIEANAVATPRYASHGALATLNTLSGPGRLPHRNCIPGSVMIKVVASKRRRAKVVASKCRRAKVVASKRRRARVQLYLRALPLVHDMYITLPWEKLCCRFMIGHCLGRMATSLSCLCSGDLSTC